MSVEIINQVKPQPLNGPAGARVASAPVGLVSILVSCCGQKELTRLCVASLLRHCRPPYELHFLDIGSLDGTADFLILPYLISLSFCGEVKLPEFGSSFSPICTSLRGSCCIPYPFQVLCRDLLPSSQLQTLPWDDGKLK